METRPHIDAVRLALLSTLADLRSKESPMDIQRAKAVAQVASVLVESAKVENEYLKITGQERSEFMNPASDRIVIGTGPTAHNPFPTSVVHTLGD